MTELVARLPRSRGQFRVLQGLVAAAGLALVVAGIVALRPVPSQRQQESRPAVEAATAKRGAEAQASVAAAAAARATEARLDATLSEAAASARPYSDSTVYAQQARARRACRGATSGRAWSGQHDAVPSPTLERELGREAASGDRVKQPFLRRRR